MLDTHARHLIQPILDKTACLFIKKKISANQVTWVAFIMGSMTGPFIIFHLPLLAVIALWLSGLLDAVDGTMARIENKATAWGTLLDITFDRVVELSVIIGLAWVYPNSQFALVCLTASIVISMTIFLTVGALSEKKGMKSFYYQAGVAERTEGFILLSLMVLLPKWLVMITFIFTALEIFTAWQRLSEAKKLLNS
jgi:archaetidylinositol phosphate synthase